VTLQANSPKDFHESYLTSCPFASPYLSIHFEKGVASGAASGNPFQYAGTENDGTGLYFMQARYYNPSLGRFIFCAWPAQSREIFIDRKIFEMCHESVLSQIWRKMPQITGVRGSVWDRALVGSLVSLPTCNQATDVQ